MAETSEIGWTDATFNPVIGCMKVSPGCKNCYAESDFDKRRGIASWGPNGTRVITSDAYWKQPLKWNKKAAAEGIRRRVFCASLADVFEDWRGPIGKGSLGEIATKPYLDSESGPENWIAAWPEDMAKDPQGWRLVTMDDVRKRLFALIDATPNLDWQLLTKRPENIRRMWPDYQGLKQMWVGDRDTRHEDRVLRYRHNVWLGTSVENQEYADNRIPHLMDCRDLSPVLFLSAEPLLGPIDLTRVEGKIGIGLHSYDVLNGRNYHWDDGGQWTPSDKVDWCIVGCESGTNRRPMAEAWAEGLANQCKDAGVPFFLKQMELNGKVAKDISNFPAAIQAREWPRH